MMISIVVKTSLVLLASVVAAALMRRSSAASRHLVWTSALFAVLCLPAAALVMPTMSVHLPSPNTIASGALAIDAAPISYRTVVFRAAAAMLESEGAAAPVAARVFPAAMIIWCSGAVLLLLRGAAAIRARRRLAVCSIECTDARICARVQRHAQLLKIDRRVTALIAPGEMMPATWGVAKPRVLLPPSAVSWTDARLDLVLLHELAHVARFDAAAHGIARLAVASAWWNPLVWFAANRAQFECERACDNIVIAAGVAASHYADELLHIAHTLPAPFNQQVAMARRGRISERVSAILDRNLRRTGASRAIAVAACATLILQLPLAALKFEAPNRTISALPVTESIAAPERLELQPASRQTTVEVTPDRGAREAQTDVSETPQAESRATIAALRSVGYIGRVSASQGNANPQQIPAGQFGAGSYHPGSGVTNPVRLQEVKPKYTDAAMQAGIEGTVELEAVIGVDGRVTDVRVTRSLDSLYGLDDQAIAAVRQTPFASSRLNDQPVPVLVTFELAFVLDMIRQVPQGQFGAAAYRANQAKGVEPPSRLAVVRAGYTPEAMRQKIEGMVVLEVLVKADGTVDDVRVTRSLDSQFGLDDQAVKAARATVFAPGRINGAPASFLVTMETHFTLR